jgi:pimeloyl-ACP methyl ester carboxylesterase
MTAVFVHGNPETAAVWSPLLARLSRDDVVVLSPPGFGAPVPPGFEATADAYLSWLEAEVTRLGPPVDLIGHDWGGFHVLRLASRRPDLVRTWCSDVAGGLSPHYRWHELALLWQTPGVGEHLVEATLAMSAPERADRYVALGISPEVAVQLAAAYDEDMSRCVLSLYRSAPQPVLAGWGRDLSALAQRPGLVLHAELDQFAGGESLSRAVARRCGARMELLTGVGHWWMTQDPLQGADALRRFWSETGCTATIGRQALQR